MKLKNKGVIYKVTHKESGKIYIGATKNSIHHRKLDHQLRAKRGEQGQFQEAIATYGADAFTWEQIDSASSINELAQKEKEYVIKYNSKKKGYNSDCGGGFQKTVHQFSVKDGMLVNAYDSLQSAADAVKANKKNISNVCLGVDKTCKGYIWSYYTTSPINFKDNRKKKVIQLDLKNTIIAEFTSVAEASNVTGCNKSSISKVCRGERNHAGGYRWRYNQ